MLYVTFAIFSESNHKTYFISFYANRGLYRRDVRKVKPAKFKGEMKVFAGNELKVGYVVVSNRSKLVMYHLFHKTYNISLITLGHTTMKICRATFLFICNLFKW